MTSPASAARSTPFRILLVEDNYGDADLVREALAGKAAQVAIEHVESLGQAQALLQSGGVDIVLLDLSLPDATGVEGVARLHAESPEIPIVVLTSSTDDALGSRALQAGAQDYLIKGQTDEWLLIRAMRYAIERQELYASRRRLLAQEQGARAAAEAEQQRKSFLAEMSMVLAATIDADDLKAQLAEVVARAVPRFADCCILLRAGPRFPGEVLAVRHVLPEKEAIVRDLVSGAEGENERAGEVGLEGAAAPRVAPGGPTSDDLTAMGTFNTSLVGTLSVCSAVVARLDSHDASGGTLMFFYTIESGRHHEPEERSMIANLAQAASYAVENARLYKEVQRAVSLREEFVSIASHELRTPLSTLTLQLTGLRNTITTLPDPKPERLLVQCGKIEKQAARLTKLVSDLLDVAQSSAGHLTLERQSIDLGELTREMVERFAEEASKAGCAVELRVRDAAVGRWDRMRLEQLLTNLLSNALKYGRGKLVEIDVSATPEHAVLSICDHGIGIAAIDVSRIFERFERAVSTRQFAGLGLGLHISREIVRAHGGSIEVKSRLGEGATFLVTLPLTRPASSPGLEGGAR
jgi:signal transduction histidine kinase/CheY-like chemotaxis protein